MKRNLNNSALLKAQEREYKKCVAQQEERIAAYQKMKKDEEAMKMSQYLIEEMEGLPHSEPISNAMYEAAEIVTQRAIKEERERAKIAKACSQKVIRQHFKVSRATLLRDQRLTDCRPARHATNAVRLFDPVEVARYYPRREET